MPSNRVIARTHARRINADGTMTPSMESLAGEEPLEIRINGKRLAVTMRTPGQDFNLVAGNLVSEGLLTHPDQIGALKYCGEARDSSGQRSFNVVDAILPHVPAWALEARKVTTTSACGICGSTTIDAVKKTSAFSIAPDIPILDPTIILSLPDKLRAAQKLFDKTGGVHAAGLCDAETGVLQFVHEDVGRHNAVDKVIGQAFLEGRLPLIQSVMQVSGRASFELVQKCFLAGVPVLAAVSAPSSLAVQLAEETGITLIGFSRGDRATVYTHMHRLGEDLRKV